MSKSDAVHSLCTIDGWVLGQGSLPTDTIQLLLASHLAIMQHP